MKAKTARITLKLSLIILIALGFILTLQPKTAEAASRCFAKESVTIKQNTAFAVTVKGVTDKDVFVTETDTTPVNFGLSTPETAQTGEFYVINSIDMIPQADVKTEYADGKLVLKSANLGRCVVVVKRGTKVLDKLRVAVSTKTEAEVTTQLKALKNTKQFKNNRKWGYEKKYESATLGGTASACEAFTEQIQDMIFGNTQRSIYCDNTQAELRKQVRIGDALMYKEKHGYHIVLVTGINDKYYTVAEGNRDGRVKWGRRIKKTRKIVELRTGYDYGAWY